MVAITPEYKISRGEKITSDNKKFTLTLQDDGNLVLSDSSGPIWATGTNGKNATSLLVQSDGNVVLYTDENKPVWATNTAGNSQVVLKLQNDRNLVLYSEDKPIWSSNTFSADADDTTTAPKENTSQLIKYTVVSGDTLSGIAEKFLGNANRYSEIAALNNIADPDLINVGSVLVIPKK